jgi:ABC-type lipoprotein export system ATPase subunit
MRRMQEEFHTSFIFCTHDPRLMAEADQTFSIRDGMLV